MTNLLDGMKLDEINGYEMPDNGISDTGVRELETFINDNNWNNRYYDVPALPHFPCDWVWEWVVTRGKYAGTLPKRYRKFCRENGVKLSPEMMSQIGNIARSHAMSAETIHFDITRDFDWTDGDFGDGGSCFWGSNSGARHAMQNDSSFHAMRLYSPRSGHYNGMARCWMRVERDYILLWNAYSTNNHQTLTFARILATMLGTDYRKIDLDNYGETNELMWINGGSGWIVGDYSTISEMSTYDFELDVNDGMVDCDRCGDRIDDEYSYTDHPHFDYLCENCRSYLLVECDGCRDDMWDGYDDIHHYAGCAYCHSCWRDGRECDVCRETFPIDELGHVRYTGHVCVDCMEKCGKCEECGSASFTLHGKGNQLVCGSCRWLNVCGVCGDVIGRWDVNTVVYTYVVEETSLWAPRERTERSASHYCSPCHAMLRDGYGQCRDFDNLENMEMR